MEIPVGNQGGMKGPITTYSDLFCKYFAKEWGVGVFVSAFREERVFYTLLEQYLYPAVEPCLPS